MDRKDNAASIRLPYELYSLSYPQKIIGNIPIFVGSLAVERYTTQKDKANTRTIMYMMYEKY
jgi:16S rRNA A1518/A1519 N6-dimethyltransferase RsmA/KsgA/DIM1 with predicted DNA glycosylase/AP lyase activity